MPGRGRGKAMRLLGETITENRKHSGGLSKKKHTQSGLPDELWEQILSRLTLKDNILSSAVSKRFLALATSVQKANKPPWLMLGPKSGDSYEFYDPLMCKSYCIELPELRGAQFIHSKYDWLVVRNFETLSLFLFRPYTRKLIELPTLSGSSDTFALSAAPTSPNCMIFSFSSTALGTSELITCRPGETEWTNVHFPEEMSCLVVNDLCFSNGLLYCFCFPSGLGIYNPEQGSWTVELTTTYTHLFRHWNSDLREKEFIVEVDGDIILLRTFKDTSPIIYKLDLPNRKLVEMETSGGMSLFINFSSCHARTDLLGNMRNSIYFPKIKLPEKRCISYSIDKGRYLRGSQCVIERLQNVFGSIWIDAPEDLSTVLKGDCETGNCV